MATQTTETSQKPFYLRQRFQLAIIHIDHHAYIMNDLTPSRLIS
jgi:hypothetical protein